VRAHLLVLTVVLAAVGIGVGIEVSSSDNPASSSQPAGLEIPATYQIACAYETATCLRSASGSIPRALDRPLRFSSLRSGETCPASLGRQMSFGVAVGTGPVRAILATAGDLHMGDADLDGDGVTGWREIKTLWVVQPSYQGPVVIRAERLDGSTPVVLGGSGALPSNAAPIVIPPGPTVNGTDGWRTAPSGTWAKSAGCYAWQVDGLTFSDVIVIRAVWRS
jgi:hypothetical protein